MSEGNVAPGRRRVFPEAFKREAVERVETRGLTYKAVADELWGCTRRCYAAGCASTGQRGPARHTF